MPNELSLPPPMTDAALRQAAQTQIGGEIAGEIGPLESELGSLEGRSGAAVQDIDKLFSTLQPSVESSAHRVGEFNKGMLEMERGIFDAATDRMNQFRQSRAAEAQALAQQLGAPVPISEFTFSQDVEGQLAPQDFAGTMLHSMGYAAAGTMEAEAFAGRVFPLIRKEETLRTQRYFADQISKIRKEIAAIKATEKGKANARFHELRLAERNYRLDRFQALQSALETKQALAQRRQELKQSQQRLALEREQLYGFRWKKVKVGGKWKMIKVPTLAARELGQQGEQFEKTLKETKAARAERTRLDKRAADLADKEFRVARAEGAAELLNAAMDDTGKGPDTYTTTVPHIMQQKTVKAKDRAAAEAMANQQLRDMKAFNEIPKDAAVDVVKVGPGQFRISFWAPEDKKVAVPPTQGNALTDPNSAVDYLVAAGYSKRIAISTVRARMGLPKTWTYGKPKPKPKGK